MQSEYVRTNSILQQKRSQIKTEIPTDNTSYITGKNIFFANKMIAVVVYKSFGIIIFCLFLLITVSWIIHFFVKIKRTLSDIKNILSRPRDLENERRLSHFKRRLFKSVLFIYYMSIEGLAIVSLITEYTFDISNSRNNTMSLNNCTVDSGSYLYLRYEYKFALILAVRKGLILYATILFILILCYFNDIYKLKEKFKYTPRKILWLIITFLPAVFVAMSTLFPWTILIDWVINGFILELTFFIGVYYAKKLNIQLKMRQQDLSHVDFVDKFQIKTHAKQVRQYRFFIKPIFVLGQFLIIAKILDEFVREFVGTLVLNACWIEETFKIKFGFFSSSEVKRIYSIASQIVVGNISLAVVVFLVTLMSMNLIMIWNNLRSKRKVFSSTPLMENYRGIV